MKSLNAVVAMVLLVAAVMASVEPALPTLLAPHQFGTGWLSTRGSDIVNSQGEPVILRGAAWMEPSWGGVLNEPVARRLDEMKSFGANLVRLPLNSAIWRGVNATNLKQMNYTTTVDWIVNNASQRGIYVLLDFHNDLYPDTYRYWCDRIYYDMVSPGFDEVYDFWSSVASRYANNPTVLYEIFGQPQHCGWYWNAGNQSLWWNDAYTLASRIQSINPNALVFVPGLSAVWELRPGMQELWYTQPLPLKNIVYSFHRYYANDIPWADYASAYNSGYASDGLRLMTLLFEYTYFQMIDRGYPIFVSETGAQITTGLWDVQFADEMELLASRNVGFSYWAWWRSGESTVGATYGLIDATLTPLPTRYGTLYRWDNVALSKTGLIWAKYLNRPYVERSLTATRTVYSTITATATITQTATRTQLLALGYPDATSGIAVDSERNLVYVTAPNLNKLFVLSGATNSILATIQVGSWPTGVAYNPSTRTVYVADFLDNAVSVIDANRDLVISTVTVGSNPQAIAVNPNTNTIYVVNTGSSTISVIDGANNAVTATIVYGASGPTAIAVNPSTNLIYVAAAWSGLILVINGISNKVEAPIGVTGVPVSSLAVNPNSNTIFLVSSYKNLVNRVSASTKATLATISTLGSGTLPSGIAANPNNNKVYVSLLGSGRVLVIDGSGDTIITTISVGRGPLAVAVNRSTDMIYVANSADATVSVISGATNSVVALISLVSLA